MEQEKAKAFYTITLNSMEDRSFLKMIFHKPKKGVFIKSVLTVYLDSDQNIHLKISNFSKTQDITETVDFKQLERVITAKLEEFYFADLFTSGFDLFFKQSKKGMPSMIKKIKKDIAEAQSPQVTHNKTKNYLIRPGLPYLKDLGISDDKGIVKPSMYHKFRQINRFIEIIDHHIKVADKTIHIADMGSGKGYLTFALHTYFRDKKNQNTQITGVELRNDLVNICSQVSDKHHLSGITFTAADISTISFPKLDMLIALHACDTATDLAIQKGIDAGAKYIILSPCCHKQIRKEITIQNEITKYGIFEERMAEMITDTIRTLILNHFGYKTQIIEYISSEHTSKNTMIIAEKIQKSDPTALEKVKMLKTTYGINYHFLEKLLDL